MSMSKKDFIALADLIKSVMDDPALRFMAGQREQLANFCASQNPRFNRARWLGYIAGTNGPNGGKRKVTA